MVHVNGDLYCDVAEIHDVAYRLQEMIHWMDFDKTLSKEVDTLRDALEILKELHSIAKDG